jgi:hypothetical protein
MGAVVTAFVAWDFTSPTLVDSVAGVTLGCTRASDKHIADANGVLRLVPDNEPCFKAAAIGGNIFRDGNSATAGFNQSGGTPGVSDAGAAPTPPSAVANANVVLIDGQTSTAYAYFPGGSPVTCIPGREYIISAWVVREDGEVAVQASNTGATGNFALKLDSAVGSGTRGNIDTGDGNWRRFYMRYTATNGSSTGMLQYAGQWSYSGHNTGVYVCGWMLEDVTESGATTPGTFTTDFWSLSGTSEYLDIEPAATNQLIYSEDFSQPQWVKTLCTATGGQAGAPNGTATMTRLLDDNGGGTASNMRFQYTVSSAMTPILSVYAKKDQLDWMYLNTAQRGTLVEYAYYDLTNGVVGATTGTDNVDQGIENIGNGVYRCWMRLSNDADSAWLFNIQPANADGDHTVARDGTSSIFVYGAQAEDGTNISLPTSYIPTNGSTVTRAADLILVDGDATIGAVTDDYSYYAKFACMSPDVDNVRSVAVRSPSQAATTAYDRLTVAGTGTRTGEPRYRTRQTGNVDIIGGGNHDTPLGTETIHQFASAYKVGDEMTLWYDGTAATGGSTIDNGPLIDYDCIEIGTDNTSGGGVGTSQIRFYAFNMYTPVLTATQLEDASNGTLPTFGMVVGDEDWTRRRKLLEWARSGIRPFGGHKWK